MSSSSAPSASASAAEIRSELLAGTDPKVPDERLLMELAANAAIIAFQVDVAADRLSRVLPDVLADARRAAVVAKALHDVVLVGSALARRVEGALSAAAALRLQRRVHRARPE
jgi:hypothetical protein